MKLRIRGDSIRVRVTQAEAARLGAGERIDQATSFTVQQQLISSVVPIADLKSARAEFCAGNITIFLPAAQTKAWAGSELVSIEGGQPAGSDRVLHILVEKDFECIHSLAEEDADAFPNPRR